LRRAVNLKPTDPSIRSDLGHALAYQGLLDKARVEFEKVLKKTPRHAAALSGMGTVERAAGRFAAAEQMFRRALEADPNLVSAWLGIAASRRMSSADSQWIADAQTLAATQTKSAPAEAAVRYAIGKCFDDLGQYAQAFENYARANELLRPLAVPFNKQVYAGFVNDLTRVYTPRSIASAKAGGSSSTRPVFVVGMPRSGTSLVEQILSSHPAVAGAGELEFWSEVLHRDEARIRKEVLPAATRQKLATDYLQVLKTRHPDAGYVVDKAPRNSDCLGLIHSVFPDARIIYMRRDPLDTCLSCFFQSLSLAHNYKFDLNDLASYYKEHARLIAHWRKVLPPGTMLDVPYEELVADQETWTRRLLAFLGLEWDERCMRFEQNPRPVGTASAWQVRQRIYGNSVQRWRNYSKFTGPLRKLDPA
jgi:tetratricopeptide (TPR) repeat protein